MRVFRGKMTEGLHASLNHRGLQPSDSFTIETGGIGQKACHAARRRRQTGVGIDAHLQIVRFSGHGC